MLRPSKSEFIELSRKGNLVPVRIEILPDPETPLTAYQKLTQKNSRNSFILESVEGGEHLGRYSFIGLNPRTVISVTDDLLVIQRGEDRRETKAPADPLRAVEEELMRYKPVIVPGLPGLAAAARELTASARITVKP